MGTHRSQNGDTNGGKIDTQLRQSGGKFVMKWETRFMLNGGAVG